MNEELRVHLQKARERLEDAQVLLQKNRCAGAVNRSYYAIFHAASAMLSQEGRKVRTHYSHHGVKVKFGQLLVQTGKVDDEFGRILSRAYDLREDADYALDAKSEISREVAEEELRKAAEFVAMAEEYLKARER